MQLCQLASAFERLVCAVSQLRVQRDLIARTLGRWEARTREPRHAFETWLEAAEAAARHRAEEMLGSAQQELLDAALSHRSKAAAAQQVHDDMAARHRNEVRLLESSLAEKESVIDQHVKTTEELQHALASERRITDDLRQQAQSLQQANAVAESDRRCLEEQVAALEKGVRSTEEAYHAACQAADSHVKQREAAAAAEAEYQAECRAAEQELKQYLSNLESTLAALQASLFAHARKYVKKSTRCDTLLRSNTHTHTHTHTLSLSLSLTHTHTHTGRLR